MMKSRVFILPMNDYQWSRVGVCKNDAPLLTVINLVEGEILDYMDGKGEIQLTDMVNQLEWPPPLVMMSIGGLIKEGLLSPRRQDNFILLTRGAGVSGGGK